MNTIVEALPLFEVGDWENPKIFAQICCMPTFVLHDSTISMASISKLKYVQNMLE